MHMTVTSSDDYLISRNNDDENPPMTITTTGAEEFNEHDVIKSLSFRRCAVDIRFKDIAYGVKVKGKEKPILNGLSGRFCHGKLNCIMGPSGSGKSSLLNVITGFNSVTKGEIFVNEVSYKASKIMPVMSKISSYLLQDDQLLADLTSRETVIYAARFKLPGSLLKARGHHAYETIADHALSLTGLTSVANIHVRQLSGGERKRLAVAVELVNFQPVVYLDECTTGLDSTSCYRLVKMLKMLAETGCNVIATIHQPNSLVFRMFDWLYVIAPGGRLAYDGHPMSVPFALDKVGIQCEVSDNPADVLFEKDNIPTVCEAWEKIKQEADFSKPLESEQRKQAEKKQQDYESQVNKIEFVSISVIEGDEYIWVFNKPKNLNPSQHHEKIYKDNRSTSQLPYYQGDDLTRFCTAQSVSTLMQLALLLKRSGTQAGRDKILRFGCLTFVGVAMLFGNLFFNLSNKQETLIWNPDILLCFTIAMVIGPCVLAVMNADIYLKIATRETINGLYNVFAYYVTRCIVDALVIGVTSTLFTLVSWSMSQLRLLEYGLPMAVCVLGAQAITIHHLSFILSLYGQVEANIYLPFLMLIIHFIFGGNIILMHQFPGWIKWLAYVNFSRYSYFGLMKSRYSPVPGMNVELCDGYLLCKHYPNGAALLTYNDIDVSPPWTELWKIVVCYGILFVLGLPALAQRIKLAKREIARI